MKPSRVLLAAVVACGLGVVASACDDGFIVVPRCDDIPVGGCPARSFDVCADPLCSAVYRCNANGTWAKTTDCPARPDTGDGGTAGSDAEGDARVSSPRDAGIDAPPGASGGPGCGALQLPDCTLGLAIACTSDCCGCEELFVCESGGWASWGSCAGGVLTANR